MKVYTFLFLSRGSGGGGGGGNPPSIVHALIVVEKHCCFNVEHLALKGMKNHWAPSKSGLVWVHGQDAAAA